MNFTRDSRDIVLLTETVPRRVWVNWFRNITRIHYGPTVYFGNIIKLFVDYTRSGCGNVSLINDLRWKIKNLYFNYDYILSTASNCDVRFLRFVSYLIYQRNEMCVVVIWQVRHIRVKTSVIMLTTYSGAKAIKKINSKIDRRLYQSVVFFFVYTPRTIFHRTRT